MRDRSTWWRTGAGIAVWLLFAVAATGIAWAAVGVVRDAGNAPAAVSLPTATESPPATSTGQPTPQGSGSAESTRTLRSAGGTVAVACGSGGVPRLLYATPNNGWQVDVDSSDADRIEITFSRGDAESRARARCRGASVEGDVDDDGR